jgi:hypothetical protein
MPFFANDRHASLRDSAWGARRLAVATSLVLLSWATGTGLTQADDAAPSPYAATLRQHGIEPDAAGMGEYLRQLHPDEQQRREARRSALMHAVFRTIELEKIEGLTAELLRAAALCDLRHLRLGVRAALRATARPDNAPLLREATKDVDKQVVIAAIGGLGAALGTRARDDLRRMLEHKTEDIRLAAARALADQGDRTSLGPLVKLLGAASLEVRIDAVKTLRQACDTRQNYAAYEEAPARKEAMGRWATWVEGEGRTAHLHFPLKRVRFELGRTLITITGQNKVIELDASGRQVWEKKGLKGPLVSTGLTNGHRLISCYGRYLVEYDASGKEVWRKDGLPKFPFNARRLDSGNTLIACIDSQKVVEIRPDGSTAWEITIKGGPVDVRRLDSGRTLVTLNDGGRVVEVDREGKVHWEIKDLNKPFAAQRLENGNTLVAEPGGGRVAVWDRAGTIVWKYTGLKNPLSAVWLSNGNTLIAHPFGVREVDRKGKIIWQKQMPGVMHATRY